MRRSDDPAPLRRDAIFRIASLTKPDRGGRAPWSWSTTACWRSPIRSTRSCPSWPDRRVLRSLESPLDDTVPAARAITVEDLLTFRLGLRRHHGPAGHVSDSGRRRPSWG